MPVSLGTTTITALFLGTTSISSAYLGNTQVFGGSFSPLSLFSGGAQGIWLDPSDLSTMFSDRAGTTPVTTPGTVVGLRLDKSKGGVGTNGASRRNILSWTEDLTNAVWGPGSGTVRVADQSANPINGEITADLFDAGIGGAAYIRQATTQVAGGGYIFSLYAKRVTGRWLFMRNLFVSGGGTPSVDTSWFDLQDNVTGVKGSGITSTSIQDIGSGWFRCSVRSTGAFGNNLVDIGMSATNGAQDAAGTEQSYIWGAQLELASSASAYQKITADWAATMAGNHAVAPTDAARPIYGIEPKGGRRNLLTWSEDFGNAVWSLIAVTVASPTKVAADEIAFPGITNPNDASVVRQAFNTSAVPYAASVELKAKAAGDVGKKIALYINDGGTLVVTFHTLTLDYVRISSTKTTAATTSSISIAALGSAAGGQNQGACNVNIRNAQLELGSTATNYQRVLSAYDITESGVATCHYVQYDGSDDSMSTAAIDFTATDKMSVFAGVRKLSDGTSYSIFAELGSGIANSITVHSPFVGATFDFTSRGTSVASATSTAVYPAPISVVLTGLGDISGDLATLRINGTQAAQSTANQGTGTFGNAPLFFGRRQNAGTINFNGRDYGIVIVGKSASAGEITDTETWLAARTSGVSI